MPSMVRRFADDENGATAIEYGMIAAMIAVTCIAAFVAFGDSLAGLFGFVQDQASTAMSGG